MADYKMYKLYIVSVHMLHKYNMPTHIVTLLYQPKTMIHKFLELKCTIRNAIHTYGIRAFRIDSVKIRFLKQVGEGYRSEAFAVQHVLLDQVFPHTFKVLRVRRHLRYALLSRNERVGAIYTLRADSLDCFLLNFAKFSFPRITLSLPTKASRDILYERRICITKKAKKKKIILSVPIRTGLNKLLFFYGLDEDYRTYHAFLERVFYGVLIEFESVICNYFFTRVIISHYGIPIN